MKRSDRRRERDEDNSGHMPGSKDVSRLGVKARSFALYGRSGSGKTTLAASFPGPAILLDVRDKGTDSVSDVEGLRVHEISSFEDFEEAYWWLKKNPKKYKTVIIDTVSQLQQVVVKEVGGDKKSSKNKDKQVGDWGTLTKRDWGDISGVMKEWIINYRDLVDDGINVVFIAQDRIFNLGDDEDTAADDDQIAPEVGPALSPAIAKVLNAAVHVIGNTFVRSRETKIEIKGKKKKGEKIEFCLRLGPNSSYVTKVRKPKSIEAPSFIRDPDYEDIMEVITGK